MNISNPQENINYTPKELFLGKAGYTVIAVNPNKAQLKEIGQYVPEDEPNYSFTREIDGKTYNGVNIKVYLRNVGNYNCIDTVTYSLINNVQISESGKTAVINKYGGDAWLEQTNIDSKTLPHNMSWYLNDGVKPAIRGEKELIKFIRALRNFKKISDKSTDKEKADYVSIFEQSDLDKMLRCDFTDIKKILMPTDMDLKVGFVLGVRKVDENKAYQDLYKEYPMRSYMVSNDGSNEYIAKEIYDAQANGKYPNTYFDLADMSYRKYELNASNEPKADSVTTTTFAPVDDLPF